MRKWDIATPKSDASKQRSEWAKWIDIHHAELVAIGIPPEVYLDHSRWDDFLQNGHLHWHDETGWEWSDLSSDPMGAIGRFLQQHFADDRRCRSLLRWITERTEFD